MGRTKTHDEAWAPEGADGVDQQPRAPNLDPARRSSTWGSFHERVTKAKEVHEVILYYEQTLAKHVLPRAWHEKLVEIILRPGYAIFLGFLMLSWTIGLCLQSNALMVVNLVGAIVTFTMMLLTWHPRVLIAILRTFKGRFVLFWTVVLDISLVLCWDGWDEAEGVIIVQTIGLPLATMFFVAVDASACTTRTRQVFGIGLLIYWVILGYLLFNEVDGFFRDKMLEIRPTSTRTISHSAKSAATSAAINLFLFVAEDVRVAFSSKANTTRHFQDVEDVLVWRWQKGTTGVAMGSIAESAEP